MLSDTLKNDFLFEYGYTMNIHAKTTILTQLSQFTFYVTHVCCIVCSADKQCAMVQHSHKIDISISLK